MSRHRTRVVRAIRSIKFRGVGNVFGCSLGSFNNLTLDRIGIMNLVTFYFLAFLVGLVTGSVIYQVVTFCRHPRYLPRIGE